MKLVILSIALVCTGCVGVRLATNPFIGNFASRGVDSGMSLRVREDGTYSLLQYDAYSPERVVEGRWSSKGVKLLLAPFPAKPWSLSLSWDRNTLSSADGDITFSREPNKAPEPTTTAGTSAAELPRVPAAVVAHL